MLDLVRRLAVEVRRMREQRHDKREERGRPEERLNPAPGVLIIAGGHST
jgi:hypothetical protein